ncbi:MAG: initiation-control protein YabA [Halanaerobiaceae bacterium]
MDKEALSTLAYFQEQLEEMTRRFRKVKEIMQQLYTENKELRQENKELREIVFVQKKEGRGEGYSNLLHLYQEGYHICHSSFGDRRKGDCLFCQKLIDNQFEE